MMLCPTFSQAEHQELPVVEVHGTNTQKALSLPSIYDAQEAIKLIAGGANIIDAEVYKKGRATTLQDAIGWSPGIFVQPRFGSEESRLSIRGSGLQRTFHLRGIKLLQDGVPVNQADGGADFQTIEPLALRYIEVFRGANALRYGSTTLGGAINFVSSSSYAAAPYQFRAEVGSFGSRRGQMSTAGYRNDVDYFLSYSHSTQEGFRDYSNQNNDRLFGNIGYRINEDIETRLFFTILDSDSQLPGNLTKAQLKTDPEQANAFNLARQYQRDFPLYRIANRTTYEWDNNKLSVAAFYTYKDLFHPIFQVLDIVSEDYGLDIRFDSDFTLFGRKNIFTIGFSPVRGVNEDNRFVNVGGSPGAVTASSMQTSLNLDLYVENQYYVTSQLALVLGTQLSISDRELDDHFLIDGDNSLGETFYGFSPKLGFRYELNDHIQFFANVSRSFEPPSFGELRGGPTITPVDDQSGTSFEIGSRGQTDRYSWDAVFYRAWIDDELLSINDVAGNPLGTINASETIHQGIELGFQINLFDHFYLRQNYLWSDFYFDGDSVFGDKKLAGIPEHFYKVELLYEKNNWYIGPNVEWVAEDYAVDHANSLLADSYEIFGLKAGYKQKNGFSVFIEGKNLTNKTYVATTGVIADAGGEDSAQFLPGDGASFFIGTEWRY